MLSSIGNVRQHVVTLANHTLNHPHFLGRMISWGVLYGALYYLSKRIYTYAYPKIQGYLKTTAAKERQVKVVDVAKEVLCAKCNTEFTKALKKDENAAPLKPAPDIIEKEKTAEKPVEQDHDEQEETKEKPVKENDKPFVDAQKEDASKKKTGYWPFT
jgi:hypothetical protein